MNIISFDGIELNQPNQIIANPNSKFNTAPKETLQKVYRNLARASILDGMGFVDLRGCTSNEEALGKCGLLWRPVKVQTFLGDGTEIPHFYAVVKSDNLQEVLGIVKDQYQGAACLDAFASAEILNRMGEFKYDKGGSCYGAQNKMNHSKASLIMRADDIEVGGDIYQVFLVMNNSFDGSSGVKYMILFQRLVCLNGMMRYLGGKKNQFQINIQHTKSVHDRIKETNDILITKSNDVMGFRREFEILSNLKLSKEEVNHKIVPLFMKAMKLVGDKQRERGEDRIARVLQQWALAYNADDVSNFIGTAWQVQLAISDYLSHADPLRDTKNPSLHFNNVTQGDVLTPVFRNYLKDQHGITLC